MRGRKTMITITLSADEQHILEGWQRSTTIPAGLLRRSRIILALAAGASICQAARQAGMSRRVSYKWIKRFQAERVYGLAQKPYTRHHLIQKAASA